MNCVQPCYHPQLNVLSVLNKERGEKKRNHGVEICNELTLYICQRNCESGR